MPPHIKKNQSDENLLYWRAIWNIFLDYRQPLFATLGSVPEEYEGNYLILSPETMLKTDVSSLKHFTDAVNSLFNTLQAQFGDLISVTFEWNYLGLAHERTEYLNYLTELFWNHQGDFEFAHDYQQYIEHPWRSLGYFNTMSQPIEHRLATDYFSPKSLELVQMLIHELKGGEYSPYFIHTDQASLQWQLILPDILRLEGALINEDQTLKHVMIVQPLTQIVI